MDQALSSFLGWALIPRTATSIVQSIYYGLTIRAGNLRPQQGSPRWVKHRRRIHAVLVIGYLLLTVYAAYNTIRKEGDFYRALGVSHDAGGNSIKTGFRRLAALHHPDKLSVTPGNEISDVQFVQLKLARDTLLNPIQRFAYDRLGPDMLSWEHCASIHDYLLVGFRVHAPSYTLTVLITLLLGVMGYLNWGCFWRYLSIAGLIMLEIYTATRPYPPHFLTKIVNPIIMIVPHQPPLLPFQMMALARKIALAISIALSQLGPSIQGNSGEVHNRVDALRLSRLEQLALSNEMESTRLLRMEITPHIQGKDATKDLKTGIRNWLVHNTIVADPVVKEAIGRALASQHSSEDDPSSPNNE